MSNHESSGDQVLRLRTFGGISVADGQGRPISNATDQRRPLALVFIVAASGHRGVTRDKLIGLLWPDVDLERARHSLTQGLYAARRAFGADDLFLTGGSIRLNDDRISSDIADFERALDSRDLGAAAALYDGPFVDGFFLSNAIEFEHWVTERRADFEERAVTALERLASEAEREMQFARAVEYRKRLAAIRPLDTSAATRLIELLAQLGNRAEAIRHARRHETLLREQLDLDPDPAFAALLARLPEVRPTVAPAPIVEPIVPEGRHIGNLAVPAAHSVDAFARVTRRRWARRTGGAVAAVGVGMMMVVAALVVSRSPDRSARDRAAMHVRSRTLLVAPFNVGGASASNAYIGGAVVELLAPRLRLDSTTKWIDAGTIEAAWHARGFDRRPEVPRDSILGLASGLGADRLVIGSVVGSPARTVLSASTIRVRDGSILARANVAGSADSIAAMVGELAAKLLAAEAGESTQLAVHWGRSPAALRRYIAGRLDDRRHQYAAAARRYQDALALDSTFATAALRLAIASDRLGNAELETDALARAWAHRDELDSRERALLVAFIGPRYPQPSSAAEQLHAWEAVARLGANSPEAWYQLGARLFHEGARLGAPTAFEQTLTALNRAVALDRDYRPALQLLGAVPTRADSDATEPLPDFADGDLTAARAVAMSGVWNAARLEDAARAIKVLESQATTTAELIDAKLAEHSLALNEGRVRDAFATTRRLHQLRPDSHGHLRLRVLDALYGDGDTVAAANAARDLAQPVDSMFSAFPLAHARRSADGCVLGQWRIAHKDTSGVRDIVNLLRHQRPPRDAAPVTALPGACAELLDASLAVATHRPDALARVLRVDSLMLTAAVAGNASSYAHILMSRLYEQLGHPRRALAAIRKHDYMIGWSAYLATTWREEGRLAASVGDAQGASLAQRRYVALRARERS